MLASSKYLIYALFLLGFLAIGCGGQKKSDDSETSIPVPITKPRIPSPTRIPTGQKLPENIDVKFINAQGQITDKHFKDAKKFLETTYNLVAKDNAKVEIILTTAIAERLDQYLDTDAKNKLKNNQALVVFLRRNPEDSNVLPALKIDNVEVDYAVLGLRNTNNKDVFFVIDKTPRNALEFCDLIEQQIDRLKISGACKKR